MYTVILLVPLHVICCEHNSLYSPSLVIVIGWERTSYDTSENEDMVELCAVITSPALFDRDPFTLQVSCSPGSAGKRMITLEIVRHTRLIHCLSSAAVGEDYQQCPSTIGPFDFGQIPPRACISVDINDDPVPEDPEDFIAVLQPSPDPLISVDPNRDQTTVNIIDNDGKTMHVPAVHCRYGLMMSRLEECPNLRVICFSTYLS